MQTTTTASWLALAQDETDATNGVNQAWAAFDVDLSAKARHLDVDDVVDRRGSMRLLPDFAREHFARHQVTLVPQQIVQELELANGEIEGAISTRRVPRHEVQLQIRRLQPQDLGWP